jgi:hypothetical protein
MSITKSLKRTKIKPRLEKEIIIKAARAKKITCAIDAYVCGLSFNLKALLSVFLDLCFFAMIFLFNKYHHIKIKNLKLVNKLAMGLGLANNKIIVDKNQSNYDFN